MEHPSPRGLNRRTVLGLGLAPFAAALAQPTGAILQRSIASTGEAIPAIGLGSWITFNVGNDPQGRAQCAAVVRAFFADGGRLIDSSRMYGSSQPVIGQALASLGGPAPLFSAEKVWGSCARRRSTSCSSPTTRWTARPSSACCRWRGSAAWP